MRIFIRFILICFITFFVAGCGPKYSVLVDGITSDQYNSSQKSSYLLLPLHKEKKDDLYFEKFYKSVRDIFEKNGNTVVDNINLANYVALINYEVSDPQEYSVTESVPITGQTGVDTHTTFSKSAYSGYVSQHTYSTPRYGVIGYNTYQRKVILYSHTISVAAYNITNNNIGKKAWQLIAVISDESSDLRGKMAPLLLVLEKYMATDTKGQIYVDIYEKNKKLVFEKERFSSDNSNEL